MFQKTFHFRRVVQKDVDCCRLVKRRFNCINLQVWKQVYVAFSFLSNSLPDNPFFIDATVHAPLNYCPRLSCVSRFECKQNSSNLLANYLPLFLARVRNLQSCNLSFLLVFFPMITKRGCFVSLSNIQISLLILKHSCISKCFLFFIACCMKQCSSRVSKTIFVVFRLMFCIVVIRSVYNKQTKVPTSIT